MEQAQALAGLVRIITVAGPLLWLTTSIGTASLDQYLTVAVDVIIQLAVPAFGLIVIFYLGLLGFSLTKAA